MNLLSSDNTKIVCVKSHKKLTLDKIYTIKWTNESIFKNESGELAIDYYYGLIDDLNETSLIHVSYFTTLSEWRNKKINELGI